MIQVAGEKLQIGSFVMYPLARLTRQISIWQKDAVKCGDTTSIINLKLLQEAGAEDKVMIIGGWMPYRNLSELYMFDIKTNTIQRFHDDSFCQYNKKCILDKKIELKEAIKKAKALKKEEKANEKAAASALYDEENK